MSPIGFVNPAALGLLALAPLLVLAYLNRSPRKERIVSSLLLLRKLPKVPAIRERIKLPPRFYLELLILLLLIFAAAYPKLNNPGERVAVLFDNSLSMGAKSGNATRFTLAKEELKKWLDLQGAKNRFTLYLSSPRLMKVTEELVDVSELEDALGGVRLSSAPDYLDGSLSQLVSGGGYDRAFVVSDKQASFSQSSVGNSFPVDARTVGDLVPNVSLVNLRLERKRDQPSTVIASLALFGSRPVDATLRASAESQRLAETVVHLEPKRIVEARLPLTKTIGDILRIEVDLSPIDRGSDGIDVDDSGYINLGTAEGKNILLVTEADLGENVLGLKALGADPIRPNLYGTYSDEKLKEFRAIVFHRAVPAQLPPVPSLFISPPLENSIFPGQLEVKSPTISSWRAESSLTNDINFQLIKLGASVIFRPPAWANAVVNSEQGPVIVSGENRGIRAAAVGFEILPFEGRRTPTISVLTLNLLSWLTGGAQFEETLRTGAALPVPADSSWKIVAPNGSTMESKNWKVIDGPPRAEESGVYAVRTKSGVRQVVVNAFHPDESSTDERLSFEASYSAQQEKVEAGDDSFWRNVLFTCLALLAVELALQIAGLFRVKHA